MNFALIFAGGRGERMHSEDVPKQFLDLCGKPVIVRTLEVFDRHPGIDGIVVVILDGWQDALAEMLERHGIAKVVAIVTGGATGQESIGNGLERLAELADPSSLVLIHDGVRPLISPQTIDDSIACARANGNAITVTPATETVFLEDSAGTFGSIVDRSRCRMARAPQTFVLGDILEAHRRARAEGSLDFIDSATLMKHYGATLHLIEGSTENIKITSVSDFRMAEALFTAREEQRSARL